MYCLHCGDCCNRMSPLNGGKCPKVIHIDDYYICGDYKNRPKECYKHDFPCNVCPVGLSVLGINHKDETEIGKRVIEGRIKTKEVIM